MDRWFILTITILSRDSLGVRIRLILINLIPTHLAQTRPSLIHHVLQWIKVTFLNLIKGLLLSLIKVLLPSLTKDILLITTRDSLLSLIPTKVSNLTLDKITHLIQTKVLTKPRTNLISVQTHSNPNKSSSGFLTS